MIKRRLRLGAIGAAIPIGFALLMSVLFRTMFADSIYFPVWLFIIAQSIFSALAVGFFAIALRGFFDRYIPPPPSPADITRQRIKRETGL